MASPRRTRGSRRPGHDTVFGQILVRKLADVLALSSTPQRPWPAACSRATRRQTRAVAVDDDFLQIILAGGRGTGALLRLNRAIASEQSHGDRRFRSRRLAILMIYPPRMLSLADARSRCVPSPARPEGSLACERPCGLPLLGPNYVPYSTHLSRIAIPVETKRPIHRVTSFFFQSGCS